MNILNVGYRSTNCYLLEPDRIGLLIDVGWPGTLPVLRNVLKKKGVPDSTSKCNTLMEDLRRCIVAQ